LVHSKGSPNRKVYSHEYIYLKERKISNDLMLHTKLLEKQQQAKLKTNSREIIKRSAKIYEIERKKYKKSTKSWFFENISKSD
jgi:hypothetical protein